MITKAALLEDLGRAGIDPHGMLLCHFSMKKIGPVENGADTVLDALMEYMKNGLLIVPCHTWSNVDDENPVFDVRETKPCVGLLPDLFRRRDAAPHAFAVRLRAPGTGVCRRAGAVRYALCARLLLRRAAAAKCAGDDGGGHVCLQHQRTLHRGDRKRARPPYGRASSAVCARSKRAAAFRAVPPPSKRQFGPLRQA